MLFLDGVYVTTSDRLSFSMVRPAVLADLPQLGADILEGKVRGRIVTTGRRWRKRKPICI